MSMRPLHVVHVIDRLGVGGAEFLLVTAARQAAAYNWRMTVVSLGNPPGSPVPALLTELGVEIHALPSHGNRTLVDVGRWWRLRQTLRRLRPDVVHTHLAYANTLAPIALMGTGMPAVATVHNTSNGVRAGQSARDRIEQTVLRHFVRARIGVGPSVARAQQQRLRRRVEVVANPVDNRAEPTAAEIAAARAELLGGSAGPLLLAAGRLTEQKALDDALRGFAGLRASAPGAVIAIAGQGHLRDALEQLASDLDIGAAVRFLGPRDDLPALMRAADIVVNSARWEGLPLVVLEAMAAGRAIVATDVGDVAFALGGTGVLVPANAPEQLTSALEELAADPARRARLGAAAAAECARRHAPATWAAQLDALYRRLAGKASDGETSGARSLRLVVLSHGYYPRIGGIERQRAQVTPRIVAAGADVTVITRAVQGAPRREVLDGVDVVRIPAIGVRRTRSTEPSRLVWAITRPIDSVVYLAGALLTMLRLTAQGRRPDVVQAHEFISTTRAALISGRLLKRPVVVMSHRSGPLGDVGRHANSARGQQLLARLVAQAALAIGVSEEIDHELAELGIPAQRRRVIHNGVDTDRFRPADAEEKQALRAQLGWNEGPTVIFTGRIMPEKRVDLLLRVWPAVVTACPAAQLVVVGHGNDEERLRAQAPAQVRFTGAVSDTAPLLRAADIFVLPSIAEGLSNALLEAQACGLPAVLTDVGAARDVVADGGNGIVIPIDDAEKLTGALTRLLTNAEERAAMAAAARTAMLANFSIDATVSAFMAAYRSLTEAPCSDG